METKYQLKIVLMTNESKNSILQDINLFRNSIATGKVNNFPSAANMKQVYWNNEMEFLSGQLLLKLPFKQFACTKTDNFPKNAEYHFHTGSVTNIECVTQALQFLKKQAKSIKTPSNFGFLYADTFTRIGCSFATYKKDGVEKTMVKCIHDANNKHFTYISGEPCTNCDINQSCSDLYQGLCEERETVTLPTLFTKG